MRAGIELAHDAEMTSSSPLGAAGNSNSALGGSRYALPGQTLTPDQVNDVLAV